MKTLKLILCFSLLALTFQSCRKGGPWGIKGKGDNVTENRTVSGFDKIHLSMDADIFYTQDSVFKVEVSAQPNILTVLEVEVENHTLKFDFKRNVWEHNKVKITIHSPNLKGLSISGSGDITVQNEITTNEMDLSISGSGNIYFPSLTATNLVAMISGTGDINISGGSLSSQSLTISGSGKIDAEDNVAQSCVAKVSGSGDIIIHVVESLKATISGSGNISYKGSPSLDTDISGSGRLIQLK